MARSVVLLGLLDLQQNIDIPENALSVHPLVAATIKKCADEGHKATVNDFREKVEDSSFLNELQNGVDRWIREIQKVTKLDRDPSSGTALQEISFWLNLERALLRIQEKLESSEVALTLDILKMGKRFHATFSFDTETGLKQALITVNDYNPLMKDFPLNDLLAATELDKICLAVQSIFQHLHKVMTTDYPIPRALRLVEAISRDLMAQLLKVLGTRRLMHITFEEFEKVMTSCFKVFHYWDVEYNNLKGPLMEIVEKKGEHLKMFFLVNCAHKRLQSRMEQMRKFRHQNEPLRTVIVWVLRPMVAAGPDAADSNAIKEVNLAYENVKEVDGLDISKQGTDVWEAASKRYEECIDRVETHIAARLRDQLGTAKNANEMFRIFSRVNALFVRPHIRGAVREYQTRLIQRVKDDIEALHEKFKVQYPQSKACRMSQVRDLPPVSGSIIWAKQIDRQLSVYMKRVEDVLGKGWENHVEGQKLKADADSFRAKLNTQPIFDEWSRMVQQRQLGVSGRIFAIDSTCSPTGQGSILKLRVNFLPEIITVSKEVRNLKWLGFRVPLTIVNDVRQDNQLYPFGISLIESVRTYECTCKKVEERHTIVLLMAEQKKEVQALVEEGINVIWESYKLDSYAPRLAETVYSFQKKVDDLLGVEKEIDMDVRSLESCAYETSAFTDILGKIQKAVDDLSLHQYSNLHLWVNKLNEQVASKLASRLLAGVRTWTQALEGKKEEMDFDGTTTPANRPGGNPIQILIHEVLIINQVMHVSPSVEEARCNVLSQLFAWENIVLSQIRIQSSRYQVGLDRPTQQNYRNLLTRMTDGAPVLEAAYQAIENKILEMRNYVDEWLRYQTLWDLQPEMLYGKLGENIRRWINTLIEMKKCRATFETTEVRKEFGPVIVDYAKVQSMVSLKYDFWHKEVLCKFASLLGKDMAYFDTCVSKQSIDTASTSDAATFIAYVQSLMRKMKSWKKQVVLYHEGEEILVRQHFQFPNSWLHVAKFEGEWSAFNEIICRIDAAIQTQVASLQMEIVAEDKTVEARTTDILSEWEKNKPIKGSLHPSDATSQLSIFETKFMRLKEDRDNIIRAQVALERHYPGVFSSADERLQVALEELQDLKELWSELAKIWESIDHLKDLPWLWVQPRKLTQQLDGLLTQLKELPARLRQYASYKFVKRLLQSYTKVVELKSDALKERHWKQLTKQLPLEAADETVARQLGALGLDPGSSVGCGPPAERGRDPRCHPGGPGRDGLRRVSQYNQLFKAQSGCGVAGTWNASVIYDFLDFLHEFSA